MGRRKARVRYIFLFRIFPFLKFKRPRSLLQIYFRTNYYNIMKYSSFIPRENPGFHDKKHWLHTWHLKSANEKSQSNLSREPLTCWYVWEVSGTQLVVIPLWRHLWIGRIFCRFTRHLRFSLLSSMCLFCRLLDTIQSNESNYDCHHARSFLTWTIWNHKYY